MKPKEKENQIIVSDENGNEHLMEVLFTYENKERNASYVFFYESNNPEEVLVMRYTDDGDLIDIDDDEEYAEVEEVFNAYQEDPEINKIK